MERRSRLTVQDDRDRFTLGAVLLRIAAAHSLGGEGWATAVSRTCDRCGRQHGRPRLPGTPLYASVSHSSDLVVVATTAAGPVGVDVELIGGPPWQRLLSSVCTLEEQACVSTPTDFLTYWVRKEAIVKATGEGLRRELADVMVAPPDSSPSLLSIVGRPTPACAMAAINVDGYTGAVAVLGSHASGSPSSTRVSAFSGREPLRSGRFRAGQRLTVSAGSVGPMRRRVHPPALAALALILATCSCTTPGTLKGSLPSPNAVEPSASPSPAPRVPSPATATPSSPSGRDAGAAGSAGFGDPRYPRGGNGGYDVESYVLDLTYDPGSNTLRSTAHLRATITSPEALNRFNLDLQPTMKVSAVTVNGTAASFVHKEAELVIKPAALLEPKSTLVVDVRYSGKPAVVRSGRRGPPDGGWYRTKSGGAFVAGEPISASAWYPVNEHPGDTATFAVTATVADGWKVISNGIPLTTDLPDPGEGRSLFRWQLNQPIASYLTTIYIDKFTTVEEHLPNGTPIVSAIGPNVEGARELATQTDTVIDVLASYLGPYPFGAAGGIFPGESSTHIDLETATRPIYSGGTVHSVDIVVHELAHQWFGNSVTLKSWSDICINECFASYAVWLWHEKVDGTDLDARWKRQMRRAVADPEFWRSPLVAMPSGEEFTAVYDRGPLALQALRNEMGDDRFFTLLRMWPATYGGRHASFGEFEAFASRIAGRDLTPFIDAWYRGTTRPPENLRYPGNLRR